MPKYDSYDYNTMGFGNDPLHSNDSNGVGGLIGGLDDVLGSVFFGDPDASSSIFGELTGYNAQQREFAQQEYMQEKQWAYDHPAAQMERMRQAGINLNTAAAGIAGGNVSAVAPAVGSPSGAPAAGLSAAAGAVNAGVGVAKAASEIREKNASAQNQKSQSHLADENAGVVKPLAQAQIAKDAGDLVEKFENNGLDSVNAAFAAIKVANGDYSTVLHILGADGAIRKYDEQMKYYNEQIRNEHKRYKEIQSSIDLNYALADQAEKNAAFLEEKTKHEEILKKLDDFRDQVNNGLRSDPYFDDWSYLVTLAEQYGYGSDQYNQGLKIVKDHWFNKYKGQYDAKNTSDALFGRVGSWGDAIGRASQILGAHTNYIVDGLKGLVNGIGNAPKASSIRKELRMILDNAYDQLEQYPDDSERISQVIDDMKAALDLSNSELVKWYNLSNK